MRISQLLSILFAIVLVNIAMVSFVPALSGDVQVITDKGSVKYDQGAGEGGHISFILNETSGAISEYSINTSDGWKVLLDNITVDGFVPSEMSLLGSLVKMSNESDSITLHDNPTGLAHVKVRQAAAMTIDLAGDLVVVEEKESEEDGEVTYELVVSDNVTRGSIVADRPFDVLENGTVVVSECKDLLISFHPHLDHDLGWMELVLLDAIADGRIDAEVVLAIDEGVGLSEVTSYNAMIQVTVRSVQENRFHIETSGDNPGGALLLVNVEESVMRMAEGDLRVTLEGSGIQHVDEPMMLLYEHPEEASYAVIDEDANQMLIYLPSEMTGVVSVDWTDTWASLLTPIGVVAIAGAVALVALAGFFAFRRW